MDGYLASAISKRVASVNRSSLIKEKTNLLIAPNKGNIVGEMSLRRLKQKQRASKRNEEPRTIRSISIGVEGETSTVHHHQLNNTFAKNFLKQEQTQTTLGGNEMRPPGTPLRPRLHEKRPVSSGGVYIP